jgi:CheY-like chemotaxis protein
LVHAEQSVSASPEKTIQVSSRVVARRILIAIDYSDRSGSNGHENPFDTDDHGDAVGLQVCQAIVQSHGGEIRLIRNLPTGSRFEVELPQYQAAPAMLGESEVIPRQAARMLTVLVVEPDVATQRKLLAVLAGRGHRAVPVPGAEEAIELVHRLRFDVTFCSVRLPGLNWVEFYEKIRRQIGTFVLLAEGYDSDLTRAFKGGEGYLLSKPLEDNEVQRLLATIEERQESPSRK